MFVAKSSKHLRKGQRRGKHKTEASRTIGSTFSGTIKVLRKALEYVVFL